MTLSTNNFMNRCFRAKSPSIAFTPAAIVLRNRSVVSGFVGSTGTSSFAGCNDFRRFSASWIRPFNFVM
jgi:hypothetical protein